MNIDELIQGLELTAEQITQLTQNLDAIEATRLQNLATDVARAEEGSVMTRAGHNLLAKALTGKQLQYTRVAIGDSTRNGEFVPLTDDEILDLEDLVNPVQDLPLIGIELAGNGTMVVQAMLQNNDWENPCWVREMGLFAQDPDTGEEVLYSYRNTGLLSGYTPSGRGAVLVNLVLNLVTIVDNATNVTAILDTSLIYVSQAQLIEHVNSSTPHPNIPQVRDELTTATNLWSNDADNHLHPISITNLASQILAAEVEPLNQLASRIDQVETNLANLFMQLGEPEANLLIFEDFTDLKDVDALKVKVLNTVGGPNDVYVESIDGILPGHYYTISDGVRAQFIRSKAIACNDGLFSVIFDEAITRTFNLSKAYLYRSTALIDDGQAGGSGKEKQSTFAPDDVWNGVQASVSKTLTLNTTQANAKNFTRQGGSFTADGFFTL